jgi:two-component system NarL family response regulator
MIRTILTDDHKIFMDGLDKLLTVYGGFEVIGKFNDGRSLLNKIDALNPDLLIIDIEMPILGGLEVVKRIRTRNKTTKILVLTMHEEWGYSQEASTAGANGLVNKSTDADLIVEIIHYICEGKNQFPKIPKQRDQSALLSGRELEIIQMLSKGHSNESISNELFISALTVKTHRRNIQKKLSADNSLQMIRIAFEKGLI